MTWLQILSLDLAVVGLACAVLLIDSLLRVPGRALGWLTAAGLAVVLASSFAVHPEGVLPHGIYAASAWTLFFKRLFLSAGLLAVLGSIDWLARSAAGRQAEYYVLMLFSLVGMMLLPGARDWVLLVVAFELMGVPLYVLAAYLKTDGSREDPRLATEAGLKLFLTGVTSSAFTFFGLALVAGLTGTTAILLPEGTVATPLLSVGMLLILAGFGFKIGAVPFHMWVPDTYEGAPTPFVAFLSVAPKAAGLAALALVLLSGWATQEAVWLPTLMLLAAASMIIGNLFALRQTDARRLLGFSGVAQMGYALVALCTCTQAGLATGLFFVAVYVFTNMGAFLVIYAAADNGDGYKLEQLAGLSRRSPWMGGALLVFLLSLAGIPFVAGFWAKLFVFFEAWRAGIHALVVIAVVTAIIALFYYLTVARSTFMAEGESDAPLTVHRGVVIAAIICLAAVVLLGLWPRPLVEAANAAAAALSLR